MFLVFFRFVIGLISLGLCNCDFNEAWSTLAFLFYFSYHVYVNIVQCLCLIYGIRVPVLLTAKQIYLTVSVKEPESGSCSS